MEKEGKPLRCFVAVNLPDEIREKIGRFTSTLSGRMRGVRWVAQENLHFTLKFLGPVQADAVDRIGAALGEAIPAHRPFTLRLRGAGVFPPRGRPKVVWLGTTVGAGELAALKRDIEPGLEPLGYPPEGRPFKPHLTIGRVKDARNRRELDSSLEKNRETEWGEFLVRRVHLMRSQLFPSGPIYSILNEMSLSGS